MSATAYTRDNWPELAAAFQQRLGSRGEVVVSEDELSFRAADQNAGLVLRRDGTSVSFMPLHGLDARWTSVVFDDAVFEVRLEGDELSYTYRIPPGAG